MMSIGLMLHWIKKLFGHRGNEGINLKTRKQSQSRSRLGERQEGHVFYDSNGDILFKGPVYKIEKGLGSGARLKVGKEHIPLSKQVVASIKRQSIIGDEPVTVEIKGLSKASMSRIVSDLQEDNPGKVFAEKIVTEVGSTQVAKVIKYKVSIRKKDRQNEK